MNDYEVFKTLKKTVLGDEILSFSLFPPSTSWSVEFTFDVLWSAFALKALRLK